MFRNKSFSTSLVLFIFLNIFLYFFMSFSHSWLGVSDQMAYHYHYFDDPRSTKQPFDLLRGLGVWDAQWYLKIADGGYPIYWTIEYDGYSSYAFFPLYPIIVASLNLVIRNVELSAFIMSNILLIANFFSLYYVVSKLYSSKIAQKAVWLLFLFPFSIFYRSYFTEGLFLFLLTWFAYFLIKKQLFIAAIFTSLLFIARPNGSILGIIFFYHLYKAIRNKEISLTMASLYVVLILIPYSVWHYLCYINTGDPFYWYHIQSLWYSSPSIFQTIWNNIMRVLTYWHLPLHESSNSKIDTLMVILGGMLLLKSKRFLKPQLWWISLFIWIFPLLVKDTMSYSRFQSVSFPLFIYLAYVLKRTHFIIVSIIFFILLLLTSIFFVNWYWIG